MSLPEVLLWRLLRTAPVKFRRQHPLGPYVLDFYCAGSKLAIEVDGIAHDMGDRPQRDRRRTAWLTQHNIEMLRIPARDVLADPDAVLRLCATPLHQRSAGPPPRFGEETR